MLDQHHTSVDAWCDIDKKEDSQERINRQNRSRQCGKDDETLPVVVSIGFSTRLVIQSEKKDPRENSDGQKH